MYKYTAIFIIALTMTTPLSINAEETKSAGSEIDLPNKIKRAISSEMNGLQHHMSSLAISVPAGSFSKIAATAEKIISRNILDKKLSKEDKTELNNTLPSEYKRIEHQLYRSAEMLKEAAESSSPQFVSLFYSKLHENCIACHSIYARERFPGFKNIPEY